MTAAVMTYPAELTMTTLGAPSPATPQVVGRVGNERPPSAQGRAVLRASGSSPPGASSRVRANVRWSAHCPWMWR